RPRASTSSRRMSQPTSLPSSRSSGSERRWEAGKRSHLARSASRASSRSKMTPGSSFIASGPDHVVSAGGFGHPGLSILHGSGPDRGGRTMILAVHKTPTLTRERYDEVVRRLTGGKARIESPSDLPFEGLLVHATGEGPDGFCIFDVFESEAAVEAFRE